MLCSHQTRLLHQAALRYKSDKAFGKDLDKACDVRAGDKGADIACPSDLKRVEQTGVMVFMDVGVLTEGEMKNLTGQPANKLKVEKKLEVETGLKSPLGGEAKYFVVSLSGLPASDILAMRRARVWSDTFLSCEDFLLQAANQLLKDQASKLYTHFREENASNNPKHLKNDAGYVNLAEVAEMIDDNARTIPQDGQPEQRADDDAHSVSEDEGEGVKAVHAGAQMKMAANKSKQAAKGRAKKAQSDSAKALDEEEVAMECADMEGMEPELRQVATKLKSLPKCFTKLNVNSIMDGAKIGRSIEAAGG